MGPVHISAVLEPWSERVLLVVRARRALAMTQEARHAIRSLQTARADPRLCPAPPEAPLPPGPPQDALGLGARLLVGVARPAAPDAAVTHA